MKLAGVATIVAATLAATALPALALPRAGGGDDAGYTDDFGQTTFRRHVHRGQAYHGPWNQAGWRAGSDSMSEQDAMDAAMAYCADRFKSYDPSTGTYMGYDGNAHPCPSG